MSELTEREKGLVAIGASIGSNCVPCIAFHVGMARKVGVTDEQIEEAITLSQEISTVPANLVVNTARAHLGAEPADETTASDDGNPKCNC
jgi:4-carboxymuconolactone decarboxylase